MRTSSSRRGAPFDKVKKAVKKTRILKTREKQVSKGESGLILNEEMKEEMKEEEKVEKAKPKVKEFCLKQLKRYTKEERKALEEKMPVDFKENKWNPNVDLIEENKTLESKHTEVT